MFRILRRCALLSVALLGLLILQPVNSPIAYGESEPGYDYGGFCEWHDSCDCSCEEEQSPPSVGARCKCRPGQHTQRVELHRYRAERQLSYKSKERGFAPGKLEKLIDLVGDQLFVSDDGEDFWIDASGEYEQEETIVVYKCQDTDPLPVCDSPDWIGVIDPAVHRHPDSTGVVKKWWCITERVPSTPGQPRKSCKLDVGQDERVENDGQLVNGEWLTCGGPSRPPCLLCQ